MKKRKKSNSKGVAKLKKIVAAAKKIYKKHPSMKWNNAVKAAAKKA